MERFQRMNPDEEARHTLFVQNELFLAEAAGKAIVKGVHPRDFVAVVIDVDDPMWIDAVGILMPGNDWQAIRDLGKKPLARGTANDAFARAVGLQVPDITAALHPDFVPEGHVRSLAMTRGGASVYYVRPKYPKV